MTDLPKFEIPSDMRAFAEKSVEQAQKAFDTFMGSALQAVNNAESTASSARAGVHDVVRMSMQFAEKNMAASFAFAQKMVRVSDAQEALKLQSEFMKTQIETLSDQAKELREAAAKSMPKP